MTGLKQLIEWIDKKSVLWWSSPTMAGDLWDKARSLLAEEESQKPTTMDFRDYFNSLPKNEQEAAKKILEEMKKPPHEPEGEGLRGALLRLAEMIKHKNHIGATRRSLSSPVAIKAAILETLELYPLPPRESLAEALQRYINERCSPMKIRNELRGILSSYHTEKPTADKGLLDEIYAYTKKHDYMLWDDLYKIMNRYTPAEPEKGLREELADIKETFAHVVNDECAKDEKHCSCVPALRMEIERLRHSKVNDTKESLKEVKQ